MLFTLFNMFMDKRKKKLFCQSTDIVSTSYALIAGALVLKYFEH